MSSLDEFDAQKEREWAYHYAAFCCDHPEKVVVRKSIAGGGVQYVYQCQRCGHRVGSAISKAEAILLNSAQGNKAFLEFDQDLQDAWETRRSSEAESIRQRYSKDAFLKSYSTYLKSSSWMKKRNSALARDKGICQGCLEEKATQVHHLSYRNVGNELLFELVSVCDKCHEIAHS